MNNDKTFQWTDEMVCKFAEQVITSTINMVGDTTKAIFPEKEMNDFKKKCSPTPILQPFFDEQKKDWEILTGISGGSDTVHKWSDPLYADKCENQGCKIHSVRRNDGEVFTVGEKIKLGIIDNFYITNVSGNDYMIAKIVGSASYNLPILEKVKERPVLFVTEDGVDIYEDHQYFYVSTDWYVGVFNAYYNSEKIAYKTFSTKEAAENYVALNKPCLSVNDVLEIQIGMPTEHAFLETKKLKELAKQKIVK